MVIGYLGDFSEGKGFLDFINIAVKVRKKGKNTKFLLVGKGELLGEAKRIVKDVGISKDFIFLGFKKMCALSLGFLIFFCGLIK